MRFNVLVQECRGRTLKEAPPPNGSPLQPPTLDHRKSLCSWHTRPIERLKSLLCVLCRALAFHGFERLLLSLQTEGNSAVISHKSAPPTAECPLVEIPAAGQQKSGLPKTTINALRKVQSNLAIFATNRETNRGQGLGVAGGNR